MAKEFNAAMDKEQRSEKREEGIAAVMTYTRNAWSNKTGEIIQTQEIITARGGK